MDNILLIQDDNSNFLEMLLELDVYYDVYTSSKYKDCLDLIKKWNPKIVILDIDNGHEKDVDLILNELLPIKTNHMSIIILGTDNELKEKEEKYLRLGVNDFISSPYKSFTVNLKINNQIKLLNYIKQIENLSLIDNLTNLPNRRYFNIYANKIFNLCKRNKLGFAVLICDIDKFKFINDTYGHNIGDLVLKEVSKLLKNIFKRQNDFVVRWGGEEFVIILNNIDENNTIKIAELIRKSVEALAIKINDDYLKVTISIGICYKIPNINDDINYFIEKADKNLYKAKNNGRNQVCF